jgi:MAC/Perforin domain
VTAKGVASLLETQHHHHHHSSDHSNNSGHEVVYPTDTPTVENGGYFPNIDYLSRGYNVFKGDPHSTSGDPGFTTSAIVEFQYLKGKQSDDRRFSLPDFVDVLTKQSCTVNFNSEEINGETSLTKSFKQDVSVNGGFGGAEFKASTSYRTKSEEIKTKKYVYVNSKATCSVYNAAYEPYSAPKLSESIQRGLLTIGSKSFAEDSTVYFNLIDQFGTHQVQSMTMGAKYGQISKLTREAVSRLTQEGITVSTAASYSGSFSIGGSTSTETEKTQAQKFDQATEFKETYTIGSVPSSDALSWSQKAINEPFPISYALRRLDEFLKEIFLFSNTLSQNQHVVDGLKQALDSYCVAHLLPRGDVSDCNAPQPDIQARVSNQCKVCQGSCGSGYYQDGGAVQVDQNWPDWASQYATGCQENTYGR